MGYEYKCVGAPERPKRKRGAKTRSDRVASAMEQIITDEAVNGWEYMRTDLVPVEEKTGLFSRTHEVHRAILVFRRAIEPEISRGYGSQTPARGPEPARDRDTPRMGDPAAQTEEQGDDRIRLAADRDTFAAQTGEVRGQR